MEFCVRAYNQAFNACCSRTKSAAPPPEVCGYWLQNPLSIERRLDRNGARRRFGLECEEEGSFAWVIIDEERRLLEWRLGSLVDGGALMQQAYRGSVEEWGDSSWACADGLSAAPLVVSDKVYVEFQGHQVLTAMTVNGIPLRRVLNLTVDGSSLFLFLDEAHQLGCGQTCMEAIVNDQLRFLSKQAKDV